MGRTTGLGIIPKKKVFFSASLEAKVGNINDWRRQDFSLACVGVQVKDEYRYKIVAPPPCMHIHECKNKCYW